MKVILIVIIIVISLSMFLAFSNNKLFENKTVDSKPMITRSLDNSDMKNKEQKFFVETKIGSQYEKKSSKKATLYNAWTDTGRSLQQQLDESNIKRDIVYEFYKKMPEPSTIVKERFKNKYENPHPRESPQLPIAPSHKLFQQLPDEAINVDEFLDKIENHSSEKQTVTSVPYKNNLEFQINNTENLSYTKKKQFLMLQLLHSVLEQQP